MSTKLVFPCALVLSVLAACALQAQEYPTSPRMPDSASVMPPPTPMAPPPVTGPPAPPESLSSWMIYPRPDSCCGPIGGDGPIGMEVYARTGASLPVAGAVFNHVLETGWVVEGGGRSLFFNPAQDAAWTVDLSVSNVHNQGQHADIQLPFGVVVAPTTVRTVHGSIKNLNRTYANLALGRECYLGSPARGRDWRWRVGFDVGGRLGSEKVELREIEGPVTLNGVTIQPPPLNHRTDVVSGVFLALHTDAEFPCGCCTFLAGFRTEWGYNWTDTLKPNTAELQEVNFLFTAGVRF